MSTKWIDPEPVRCRSLSHEMIKDKLEECRLQGVRKLAVNAYAYVTSLTSGWGQ